VLEPRATAELDAPNAAERFIESERLLIGQGELAEDHALRTWPPALDRPVSNDIQEPAPLERSLNLLGTPKVLPGCAKLIRGIARPANSGDNGRIRGRPAFKRFANDR